MCRDPSRGEIANFPVAGRRFAGLVIGLAIALGIAFYLNRSQIPFVSNKPKAAEKDAAKAGPPIAGMPQGTTVPAGARFAPPQARPSSNTASNAVLCVSRTRVLPKEHTELPSPSAGR